MSEPVQIGPVKIGIVTISDRASRGVYEDKGGPAIREELTRIVTSPGWRRRGSYRTSWT